MGTPTPPAPVKLFIAVLAADTTLLTQATTQLEAQYGRIDLESAVLPWEASNYYQAEMGEALLRRFVAFEHLIPPESLVQLKHEANDMEHTFASPPGPTSPRQVNLDPGYVDKAKLVLASTKGQAHRIFLSQGIYAEVTLLYHHGDYHPFIYTYEDYRWTETHTFLKKVRKTYLRQLREREKKS